MAYSSLRAFIKSIEEIGELSRVSTPVSPFLEITEITDRIVKNGGNSLLFENNGTEFPLLINMFGSEKRMCLALGVKNLEDISVEIDKLFKDLTGPKKNFREKLKMLPRLSKIASWMPGRASGKGACQEVRMLKPDLSKLPVITCWPSDGGPFITLPMVHTKDPETGMKNLGMYRMQVMEPDKTGMHWHLHKGSAAHFRKYKELGIKMPVTVTLGGDPVYTYCATAPLPENIDEYLLAGFLRKKKVEMVKCLTNELEVPSDVDFVIEGYVDPSEELVYEGPFGDHTGFYSLADYYPAFHITCITHRKDAVYPATIVGVPPMEDGFIGKATERIFLTPIRATAVPELIDMIMPEEGVFHNIALVKIKNSFPGQAIKVMNALWGAGQMMFNKIMIITDETVDIHNYPDLLKAVYSNVDPVADIHFIGGPLDVLDHSGRQFAYGTKMGIDATTKSLSFLKNNPKINEADLISAFPAIKNINRLFLDFGLLIVSIERTKKNQVVQIFTEAFEKGLVENLPFIIVVDYPVDVNDASVITWITAGNIDCTRDCSVLLNHNSIVVDGTMKSLEKDNFKRDWPNVLVMDDSTINLVDKNWGSYKLGLFLPSPSHKLKPLVLNNKATV